MTTDLTACVQIEPEPAFIQASIGAPTGRAKHRGRFYVLEIFPYNTETYPCQSANLSNR